MLRIHTSDTICLPKNQDNNYNDTGIEGGGAGRECKDIKQRKLRERERDKRDEGVWEGQSGQTEHKLCHCACAQRGSSQDSGHAALAALSLLLFLLWWQAPKASQNIAPTFSCQLNFPFFPHGQEGKRHAEGKGKEEGDPAGDCIDCTR